MVRKDESDCVETVSDSVRRQEVDIDHASTGNARDPAVSARTSADVAKPGYLKPGPDERAPGEHTDSLAEKAGDKISEVNVKGEDKLSKP